MSWGIRIAILYGAFVAMILFLVFRTMNEDIELVSPDYYENELKFQNQIDRQNQSILLNEQPYIEIKENTIAIKFPAEIKPSTISGAIKFYCPSNSSSDFTINLQVDSSMTQLVSSVKFKKGTYQAQVTWSAGGKNYYNEIPLNIP
ncbi:MAG: FixH family protein [Bacteroidota bacterium]|nr:FixH family protein [Bacteroidota bacterium]